MTLTWNRNSQLLATAAGLVVALAQLLYFNSLLAAAVTLGVALFVAWNRNETVTAGEWRLLVSTASLTTLFLAYAWLRGVLPYHYNLVAFGVLGIVMTLYVPPVWRRLGGTPAPAGRKWWIATGLLLLLLMPQVGASTPMLDSNRFPRAKPWCDDIMRIAKSGAATVDIQNYRVATSRESATSIAITVDFSHRFNLGACFQGPILRPVVDVGCRPEAAMCPVQGPDQLLTEPFGERCTRSTPPVCKWDDVEVCIAVYPSPCGGGYEQIPRARGCLRLACPNVYISPSHANVQVHLTFGMVQRLVVDEDVDFGVGGLIVAMQACLRTMKCGMEGRALPFHATIGGITKEKLAEWGFPKNTGAVYVKTTVTYTYPVPDLRPSLCITFTCPEKPVSQERSVERTVLRHVGLPFGAGQWMRPMTATLTAASAFLWDTVDEKVPGLGLGALLQPGLVDQVVTRR